MICLNFYYKIYKDFFFLFFLKLMKTNEAEIFNEWKGTERKIHQTHMKSFFAFD